MRHVPVRTSVVKLADCQTSCWNDGVCEAIFGYRPNVVSIRDDGTVLQW